MTDNYNNLNSNLKSIHDLMINIKIFPNKDNRTALWKYCINNKIDFLNSEIENKENIINNGFEQSGYIKQLFSIFKDNE